MFKFLSNLKFIKTNKILRLLGFKEILEDRPGNSIVFKFTDNRVACLNMDDAKYGYSLEASLNFTGELINLKTLSDIASLTYASRCHVSRVYPSADRMVRVNVLCEVGRRPSISNIKAAVAHLDSTINTIAQYMDYRLDLLDKTHWDLSMFEDVDIAGFVPQSFAEEMEFLAGSWDKYAKMVSEDYSDFDDHPEETKLLSLIAACARFEVANKVKLSEVGDKLSDELTLSRQQIAAAQDNYGVN